MKSDVFFVVSFFADVEQNRHQLRSRSITGFLPVTGKLGFQLRHLKREVQHYSIKVMGSKR